MSPFLHQLTAQVFHPETRYHCTANCVGSAKGCHLKDKILEISGVNVEPASIGVSRGFSVIEDIVLRGIARVNDCRHHPKNLGPIWAMVDCSRLSDYDSSTQHRRILLFIFFISGPHRLIVSATLLKTFDEPREVEHRAHYRSLWELPLLKPLRQFSRRAINTNQ